jgi:hypothetical protein
MNYLEINDQCAQQIYEEVQGASSPREQSCELPNRPPASQSAIDLAHLYTSLQVRPHVESSLSLRSLVDFLQHLGMLLDHVHNERAVVLEVLVI